MRYRDRKSTRLNSSHGSISYAVFCLKKKAKQDLLPPLGDAPDHDLGGFIMDGLAGVAHKTGQIVAGRKFLRDRRPAIAAAVHGQVTFAGIMPQVNGRG